MSSKKLKMEDKEDKKKDNKRNLQAYLDIKTHFKLQEMKVKAGVDTWPELFDLLVQKYEDGEFSFSGDD